MKSLLLVQKEQKILLDNFYSSLQEQLGECKVLHLTAEEQSNLKNYFQKNIDVHSFDRIIFFLRFKKEIRQVKFIQTIPNLVILEHDACQNYINGCKYKGKFSYHYSQLPWARILVSGKQVCEKLQLEGYDAHFVPKAYDEKALKNLKLKRDIECGFIGSLESRVYSNRKKTLEDIANDTGLQLLKTQPGGEYLNTMNRIRFFINSDAGLGEYMVKNFEAMACGCVLFTYSQGHIENDAFGFKDMENIVLYNSNDELLTKLNQLRENPNLADKIAAAGQALAESNFTWEHIAHQASNIIAQELRTPVITKRRLLKDIVSWQ